MANCSEYKDLLDFRVCSTIQCCFPCVYLLMPLTIRPLEKAFLKGLCMSILVFFYLGMFRAT